MDSETLNGLSIHDDGEGVLRLVGEIDLATAPELQRHLRDNPAVKVIDMRHVTFIDCRGISVLVLANRTAPSPTGSHCTRHQRRCALC